MLPAMRSVLLLLFVAACGSSSQPSQPEPIAPVTRATDATLAADKPRCLPIVAKECGCVYACAIGRKDGDTWKVKHAFWGDTELVATIDRWCVGDACTEAFHAEIVCDGICMPKPADPTCHFDASGACVGK